jgi:RNA polymerase sigma-70 factor (ECF subfamily)
MTESSAMAEEIVQDVFLKIWLKREELKDVQSFEAYLVTAARNKTYDYLRSQASQKDHLTKLGAQALAQQESTEDWMINKDYQRVLRQGIDMLPPQQQKVYLLSREEGLKREEIAERLGISPETVKIHLGNANKKLRAYCMARLDLGIVFLLLIKNIL